MSAALASALLVGLHAPGSAHPMPPSTHAPDVVIITADDLGWADLPSHGNRTIVMPNLNRLASEGIRFDRFYSYPVCSPARAALLTGHNPVKYGLTDFIPGKTFPFSRLTPPEQPKRLPSDIPTLGKLMKHDGYTTGYFGKWHLGRGYPDGMQGLGYDDWLTTEGSAHIAPGYVLDPPIPVAEGTDRDVLVTDRAKEFIASNRNRRFFLEVHYSLPHTPLEVDKASLEEEQRLAAAHLHANAAYTAAVRHLDSLIGQDLGELDSLGLARNTMVVFMSDNGGLEKEGDDPPVTSNAPLSGQKGTVLEGGIRVPFLLKWPGVVKGGSVDDQPAFIADVYPTLAAMTGAKPAAANDPTAGTSLLPALQSSGAKPQHEGPIVIHYPHYHHDGPSSALIDGTWKLIHNYETGHDALFDLAADPGEHTDLSVTWPAERRDLRAELDKWLAAAGARLPTVNPNYDWRYAECEGEACFAMRDLDVRTRTQLVVIPAALTGLLLLAAVAFQFRRRRRNTPRAV